MKLKIICLMSLILYLCLIWAAVPIFAQEIPPLPHAFHGLIQVNGQPAAIGTTIEARGNGVVTGIEGNPIVTAETGHYGSPSPTGLKLVVQGNTLKKDNIIEFYVNGYKADQTYPFASGTVTELDLTVNIPVEIRYTLTTAVSPSGAGTVSLSPAKPAEGYTAGTVVTLTAIANTGYNFYSWSGHLTGSTNPSTITMNSAKNIIANFTASTTPSGVGSPSGPPSLPNRYFLTATVNPAGSGTVSFNPGQPPDGYIEDTKVILIATANAGYAFDSWVGGHTGTSNPDTIIMDSNKSVIANFRVLPRYTMTTTVSPAQGGTVNLNPPQPAEGYYEGTTVTLTAIAGAGYTFSNWGGDLNVTSSTASIAMDSNKNVTANFTAVPHYTLTVNTNPAGGGTVNLSPTQPAGGYDDGTVVTLTVTANTGYVFSNWSGDLTGATTPTTITMDANKNVTANFNQELAAYTLSVTSDPAGGGAVTLDPVQPVGGYNEGTVVTLTATANTGYLFSGWSGDLTGTTSPITLTMNTDKNVTAKFTVEQPLPAAIIGGPTPTNWWLIGGASGAAVLVIAGMLYYFLVRRQSTI